MPKIVDDDKRRNQIIEQATRIFIQYGYTKTKYSQIAAQCGLGRTTIYQYFQNKEEIFIAVVNRLYSELEAGYRNIVFEQGSSSIEKIRRIIYRTFRDYYRKKKIVLVIVDYLLQMKRQKTALKSKLNQRTLALQQVLQALLEEGIRNGELRPHDTANMSWVLFSLIRAFIIQVSIVEEFSLRDLKESIDILLDGLTTKAA